jgi:mRNA interferase RelE/StbE
MRLSYAKSAVKDLESLERRVRDRIREKLRWFAKQDAPLAFAEPLTGMPGLFRYRIGPYRAIFKSDGTILLIIRIKKRSEAYR